MKKAILTISFGTSYTDTLEKTIGAVEKKISNEFNTKVFRAFTSEVIIKKLSEGGYAEIDNVKSALEKLYTQNYTDIFCVPTHIMNGAEYDKACGMINKFKDKMNIRISRPLISLTEDYFEIAGIFKKYLTGKNRLYIFMGHGSEHFANSLYSALDYHFKNADMDNVYVGTVEGFPDMNTVIGKAKETGIKNITLRPLMLVSGDHVRNDMAVKWKNAFEKNGFNVECDFMGLGEMEDIQNMYCNHLRDIWEY